MWGGWGNFGIADKTSLRIVTFHIEASGFKSQLGSQVQHPAVCTQGEQVKSQVD